MTKKFKPGDLVRCTAETYPTIAPGEVVKIDHDRTIFDWRVTWGPGYGAGIFESDFEPVTPPFENWPPQASRGIQVVYWVVGEDRAPLYGPTFDRKAAWEFADAQPGVQVTVLYSYLEPKGDVHWARGTI